MRPEIGTPVGRKAQPDEEFGCEDTPDCEVPPQVKLIAPEIGAEQQRYREDGEERHRSFRDPFDPFQSVVSIREHALFLLIPGVAISYGTRSEQMASLGAPGAAHPQRRQLTVDLTPKYP